MAQKVQVLLTSDVSGEEASETLTFALDGTTYEIDLTDAEAQEFRNSLRTYVNAGRKTSGSGGGRRSSRSSRRSASENVRSAGYDPAAVRKWAEGNGIAVSPRGRISAEVLKQFREAGN